MLICAKMTQPTVSYDAADWQHQRCCMTIVLRMWLSHCSLRVMQFKLNSDSEATGIGAWKRRYTPNYKTIKPSFGC